MGIRKNSFMLFLLSRGTIMTWYRTNKIETLQIDTWH